MLRLAGHWGILIVGALGSVCLLARHATPTNHGVQTATEIRLMDPGWWPTKTTVPRKDYVGSQACVRCHADKVEAQKNTPMARALRFATAGAFEELAQGTIGFHVGSYQYDLTRNANGAIYSVTDGRQSLSVRIGWIFGNGEFGRTYVYERDGPFYESRLSYYTAAKALDFTTGNPRSAPSRMEVALGRRMSKDEPVQCFSCHATAAATNEGFDPTHLVPGVTCEACHGPGAEHVAVMSLGPDHSSPLLIMNPARLGPVDAIDFCGACHRTSVDVALAGVSGILTLRFPAYRLERSRCWGGGDSRLTCTACHDPHQPRVRVLASYDQNCLGCHLGKRGLNPTRAHPGQACPVAAKDCVTCHMPKYSIPDMHTSFTEHKIAIHRGASFSQ
jgi:predicted CXXCH cytochrome family protein